LSRRNFCYRHAVVNNFCALSIGVLALAEEIKVAYFSNGTEGMIFDEECSNCIFGEKPCPIALIQFTYNYDQCRNEKVKEILDMLVNQKGECSMKRMDLEQFIVDARPIDMLSNIAPES